MERPRLLLLAVSYVLNITSKKHCWKTSSKLPLSQSRVYWGSNLSARIADDLVKPVLHKLEKEKHIYWTLDGAVRYQYLSQPGD